MKQRGRGAGRPSAKTAQLYFRPVLCETTSTAVLKQAVTPPRRNTKPATATSGNATLPTCAPSTATTAANLGVSPSNPNGNAVSPDQQFSLITNTTTEAKNYPNRTVLLPQIAPNGTASTTAPRYVMGPEQMTGHAIGSAQAQQDQTGNWVVTTPWPDRPTRPCGTRWRRRTSTRSSGLSWTASSTRHPSSSRAKPPSPPSTARVRSPATSPRPTPTSWPRPCNSVRCPVTPQAAHHPDRVAHPREVGPPGRPWRPVSPAWLSSCSMSWCTTGRLGLVVISGLALTAALLWAIISALGHTSFSPSFDLAGITGLIVSIGITVDSYIVYFERLKDETRSGRSVRTCVDRGFKSAWRTVWAADFVSLLAAVVLYVVAVGRRQGLRLLPRASRPFWTWSSPGSTPDPWSSCSAAVTA